MEKCKFKTESFYLINMFAIMLIILTNLSFLRIGDYSVVSTPHSVIYFGGDNRLDHYRPNNDQGIQVIDDDNVLDLVCEYKNGQWTLLGNMAAARITHRSIYVNNLIYIIGSGNK